MSELKKPDAIDAFNLLTGQRNTYVGATTREAVIAAYAQERGDWNTWEYEEKYGKLVEQGGFYLFCGNWAVRRPQLDHELARNEKGELVIRPLTIAPLTTPPPPDKM
jgi:hypothetical protein